MIEVLDVNDESPRFSQAFGYALVIPENITVGTLVSDRVKALDRDGGQGGVVRYFISGAIPLAAIDWFIVDPITGDITLSQRLDREENPTISLSVTASDQGLPQLMSMVTVLITVSDVNDNAPMFTQQVYTRQVPEFIDIGSRAISVLATDPDLGSNAQVVYSLSTNPRFTVNPNSGEITTTGGLDHETQNRYSLTVQACDSGQPEMCSSAVVIITVQDFNDEPPSFDLAVYTVDICIANASAGTYLVQPVAIDRDSGRNSQLTYALQVCMCVLMFIITIVHYRGTHCSLLTLQLD